MLLASVLGSPLTFSHFRGQAISFPCLSFLVCAVNL